MPNYNLTLQSNNADLQVILKSINELPETGGGVNLPELTNEGSANDLLDGKQLIDGDGSIITGTIPTKTSSNLTASGATVTVPAGYYASQATKSVATATQATPNISVDSAGKITASVIQTEGYVSAGTKTSTHQLAFQPAKTVTPSTASQIAVSSGYYTGGDITVAAVPTQSKTVTPSSASQNITPDSGKFLSKVTVNAIPSTYVKPTSTKGATTYTPTTTNQTISAGTYCSGAQTIKGDANLVAANIKSGVSIFGVSGTLVEGSGGGSGDGYDEVDSLITRTISSCTNSRVSSVGDGAFIFASNLKSVDFPNVKNIGNSAFYSCSSLATVSFPAATSIGNNAFYNCRSLTTASFPAATSIGNSVFYSCHSLTTANFPEVTSIGDSAFYSCSVLTTASFPQVKNIGNNAFSGCRILSEFYLTGSSVCKLSNSNAFLSTPYAGYKSYFSGTPYIYVPASLVSAYQSATNWTYFSSYFSAIDGGNAGEDEDTFTFDFTDYDINPTFKAKSGMTWGEFINSEYNTGNVFSIDTDGTSALYLGSVFYGDSVPVTVNEIISPDVCYDIWGW